MDPINTLLNVSGVLGQNGSGGGSATLIDNKDVSVNGEYPASADNADGYKKVTVAVPNTYAAGDEGKVVSNGALVSQTAHAQVTSNGTVDTTLNNSVEVAVNPNVTTKTITENGTYDAEDDNADGYSSVTVNVADMLQYARKLDGFFTLTYGNTYLFPFEEITINAPLVTSINNFWSTGAFSTASQKNRGVKKITLNIKQISVSNANAFNGTPDLEEIVVNANNAVGYIQDKSFASYLKGLKKISGIVFSGNSTNWALNTANNILYFPTGSSLEEIRFVADSCTASAMNLAQHGKLSNDSIVSIANALNASNVHTLYLHADVQARLSAIMGTVSAGVFTIDAGGSTSILDFITNTKGWTVA